MRTPTIEEAQNKEETVQSEKVQCVKVDTPTLDDHKAWNSVKTSDSHGKNRIKKHVTCDIDMDPRLRVRSNFLDGSSQGSVGQARSIKLKMSHRFEVLGADVMVDRNQHEVSLERDSAKNQDETEAWCTNVTKKRSSRCKDAQLTHTMRLQFLESGHAEEMVNGLDEGWMRVSSIMDSGAVESVAPPTTCPHIPLAESPGSPAGQEYRTAGGERLRNKGQRHLQAWTDEGCPVGMTHQVADVTKPLSSVSTMCDAGDVVTFNARPRHGSGSLRCTGCSEIGSRGRRTHAVARGSACHRHQPSFRR